MTLFDRAKEMAADFVAMRRDLHRHPELSFNEVRTAGIAAAAARELGLEVRTQVGKTGVVADLTTGEGPTVAIRGDMDALPIQETGEHDYLSTVPGIMHACGHDGHVTGVIGAMRLLTDAHERGEVPPGRIRFLFQPSEETTDAEGRSGAMRMVEDGAMEGVDAVIGLHLGGPLPLGAIFLGEGAIMAGAEELSVEVHGKAGHGARPDLGVDAIVLASQGILAAQQAVSRRLSPLDKGVLTFGRIKGGSAINQIPDHVLIEGSMRFFSEAVHQQLRDGLEGAFRGLEAQGARVDFHYASNYPPVVNDPEVTSWARGAAAELFGPEAIVEIEPQTLSEDFSVLANEARGTFMWVGAALPDPRHHHTPDFDIDEAVLPVSAALLAGGAIRILKEIQG
jgi:amidohydrolase